MFSLSAKTRKELGKKTKNLRKKGLLPAVLYGPKIKNHNLEVDVREFEKVYGQVGKSALISLETEGKKYLVLINDLKKDPLTDKIVHVDFYQPPLDKKIEAKVPIIFEGEAPAVKNLGGTLIKNISEVGVKALPQNLPREIKVNVEKLARFEDHILIKDLKTEEGVEILKNPEEIIASVAKLEKVEEELAKPVEEKIEEVKKVEKEKGKKEEEEPVETPKENE